MQIVSKKKIKNYIENNVDCNTNISLIQDENITKEIKELCKCEKYFYIDDNNEMICVNEKVCPSSYPYKLPNTKECIKCEYVYLTDCVSECPNHTCLNSSANNNYCYENTNDFMVIDNFCVDIDNIKNNNYSHNIDNNYTKFQYYNSTETFEEQSKNYPGLPHIDLSECFNLLKTEYNLSQDAILDIVLMEYPKFTSKSSSNSLSYLIYYEDKTLDTSKCKNLKTTQSLPITNKDLVNFELAKYFSDKYDIFNLKDSFYSSYCINIGLNGNDITKNDRIKDIYPWDAIICNGCKYEKTNYEVASFNCKCNVNDTKEIVEEIDEVIDYQNIILSKINYKYLKCFNSFGGEIFFRYNIGFIISCIIFLCYFIDIIYIIYNRIYTKIINNFRKYIPNKKYLEQLNKNSLFNKLYINAINNIKGEIANKNWKKDLSSFDLKKEESFFSTYIDKKKNNLKNPIRSIVYYFLKNIEQLKNNSTNNRNINREKTKKNKGYKEYKENKISNYINYLNSGNLDNSKVNLKIIKKNLKKSSEINMYKNIGDLIFLKYYLISYKFNLNNLNLYPYGLAIIFDERNINEIYISFLKYKLLYLKAIYHLDEFIYPSIHFINILFILYLRLIINAHLFSDDVVHEKYINNSINLLLRNILSIISTIISSTIISFISKNLDYSYKIQLVIHHIQKYKKFKFYFNKLNAIIRTKLILYISFIIIISLFLFYDIVLFCTSYRNSQFSLIYNWIIGILQYTLGYFVILFFLSLLRYKSLRGGNRYFFNLSKFIYDLI